MKVKMIFLGVFMLGLSIVIMGRDLEDPAMRGIISDGCSPLGDGRTTTTPSSVSAPFYSPGLSYVAERIYLDATVDGTGARVVHQVNYRDGFGRTLQNILVGGSLSGVGDVIVPYWYGFSGDAYREYLPYVKASNLGTYDSVSFSASNWSFYGSDAGYAYSESIYDGSPLHRVVKQTGPGAAWHVAGKGMVTSYGYNGPDEVRLYRVASGGGLSLAGSYGAGLLEKTAVTDEDGNRSEVFTDSEGRTVLSVRLDGEERLETYTVYDDRGRLCRVLPPEAVRRLGAGADEEVLALYAFRYTYDLRDRLIEKSLPGCAPVYYVYDAKDRLVLSQDGVQRDSGRWSYSLYDKKNRVVESGEVTFAGEAAHSALQEAASGTDRYVPSGERTALQYCAYDGYRSTPESTVLPFVPSTPDADYSRLVGGLLTSTKTRVLGSDVWLRTTFYYDDHGRLIQFVGENVAGGFSRMDTEYDFVGNIVKQLEVHDCGQTSDTLERLNFYDSHNYSRLLRTSIRLNGGSPAVLCYGYDGVGRLISRSCGNLMETLDYNVRGWLTSKESSLFRMKLRYEHPEGIVRGCYNGNISEWEWQHGSSAALMYGFSYDGFNRFTGAVEQQKSDSLWDAVADHYTEEGVSYDLNGNLLTLQRTASGVVVDDLSYRYTGNRLTELTENVRTPEVRDVYVPGSSASGSYYYDANGNLETDERKALNLSYNVLNLVSEVYSGGSLRASYTWLADGTKLGARDGSGDNGFNYLGSLIYRKSAGGLQLAEARFGEGVIAVDVDGRQEVNYFLTDHLGSVRVVTDGDGELKEQNDYYPFGARHVRSDYARSTNRLKYNGKEEQTTGNLGYLDYGARMYDAELGRWMAVDPMGEKYYPFSPYSYVINNPLIVKDPNGADLWFINSSGRMTLALRDPDRNILYTLNEDNSMITGAFWGSNNDMFEQLYKVRFRLRLNDMNDGIQLSERRISRMPIEKQQEMFQLFFFLADNTNIEWSYAVSKDRSEVGVATSTLGSNTAFAFDENNISLGIHSHVKTGELKDEVRSMDGDRDFRTNNFFPFKPYYVYMVNSGHLFGVSEQGVIYYKKTYDLNQNLYPHKGVMKINIPLIKEP